MTTTTEIRKRLESKAGAEAGTREYWDCVEALLDVADPRQHDTGGQRMSNQSNYSSPTITRSQTPPKGAPTMTEVEHVAVSEARAKYLDAKRGALGAVNFALVMGTLVGTALAIWEMVR